MAVQAGNSFSRLCTVDFSIGNDNCSSLEAPVLALQAVCIPHICTKAQVFDDISQHICLLVLVVLNCSDHS